MGINAVPPCGAGIVKLPQISAVKKTVHQVTIPQLGFHSMVWTKGPDGEWEDQDGDRPDYSWISDLLDYVVDNENRKNLTKEP